MGAISVQFQVDGQDVIAPKEWQDIKETFSFGQISNQPVIENLTFSFVGDGARLITEHYKKGKILEPIPVSMLVTQRDLTVDYFDNYIIDLTEGVEFVEPDFNNEFNPLEVRVTIRKEDGMNLFSTELQGITWGLLEAEGAVSSSDYVVVKTAVQKLYNALDICIAILSLYVIYLQTRQLIDQIKETIADSVTRLGGTDVARTALNVVYIALMLVLQTATALLLTASLVSTIINLITLLIPPIVKNKAMTWRRGYEIICGYLGYEFVSSLDELDTEVILPSKPRSLDGNILDGFIPTFPPNEKGYPNSTDEGYIASEYFELGRKRFNARFDIVEDKVLMRWEDDPDLFKESTFTPSADLSRDIETNNITEIPNTRIISFETDSNDEYTTEYYKGTAYEVKNKSKKLPFKGLERINFNLALGHNKSELNNIEKVMVDLAKAADTLASVLGQGGNLESRIKKNRVNVLQVSSNNYTKAKLLNVVGGNIPRDHRQTTSAKAIENKYYINRSIVRGTGQKIIIPNYTVPFNLKDRQSVVQNGNFVTSRGEKATFRTLEYSISSDLAKGEITINSNYIASGDIEETFIEPS